MTILRFQCGTPFPLVTTYEPSSPFVGEVINFTTVKQDATNIDTDDLKDRWTQKRFSDTSGSYSFAPEYSKVVAPGWNSAHVFETAGIRTVTTETWLTGGITETDAMPVTVVNPDAYSWTHTYWVDINGSTTGMDPEDSNNTHILTEAAWKALSETRSDIRIRFPSGSTQVFTLTSSTDWPTISGSLVYYDVFGGTSRCVWDIRRDSSFFEVSLISTSGISDRRIVTGYEVLGHWNAKTGRFDELAVNFCNALGTDPRFSVHNCVTNGVHRFLQRPGGSLVAGGIVDCKATDSQDYGLATLAGDNGFAVRGCMSIDDPFSARGDGKPSLEVDFGDHASVRNNTPLRFYIAQNRLYVRVGWSPFGFDRGIQPCVRAHTEDSLSNALTECISNTTVSRVLISTGHHSAGSTQQNVTRCLVARNNHNFAGQGSELIASAGIGGVVAYSNIAWMPDIDFAQSSGGFYNILTVQSGHSVSTAAANEPVYLGFNTFLSDADTRWSGAGNIASIGNNASIPNVTEEHNLFSGDNHTGTYTASTSFARGDNFRPITGSSAEVSVTGGVPISFDGVKNTGSTLGGAHHTSGASVSVTDPVLTSTTISLLSDWSEYNATHAYGLTDYAGSIGDTDAVGWGWTLDGLPFDVKVGGDPERDRYLPVVKAFDAGTLRLTSTIQNRSGVKVTINSNELTVPEDVLTDITLGTLSGTTLPVTVDITNTGVTTPITVYYIGLTQNQGSPKERRVLDDTSGIFGGSFSTSVDGTTNIDTGSLAAGNYKLHVVAEDSSGRFSSLYSKDFTVT